MIGSQTAFNTGQHGFYQVTFQQGHEHQRFRIAKPGVEFQYLQTTVAQHQAGKQDTDVGIAFSRHTLNGRLQYRLYYLLHKIGRQVRGWAECAHTTGVGTAIIVKNTFVIPHRG
jgi:N-acetyl-beta-hexosaminidase